MVHVVIISLGMEAGPPAPFPEPTFFTKGEIFRFDLVNWGTVSFFHESTMKALGGGFVYSRIFDQTLSIPVVASTISTGAGDFTRTRSSAITFTNGNEYVIQYGVRPSQGHSGEIRGGKIIAV